jgi:integrase/recombinase XerD
MKKPTHERARALVSRATGPLASHLDAFVVSLIEQQYRGSVTYIKARHGLALDRWLAKRQVVLCDLSEAHIERYQNRRRRRRGSIRIATRQIERKAVTQLLELLRARSVCPAARRVTTAAEDLVTHFAQHLQDQQGLACTTIERYCWVARQFLNYRFRRGAVDLRLLCAGDAIAFVKQESQRLQAPALKCVTNSLRSLLRYAQFRGEVQAALAAAVPAVSAWSTTPALPKAISPEHARCAIEGCDLRTDVGLRDRAVLLLLARLGLRAHEIVALQLGDLNWDHGQIRVRGKGGREQLLPLPTDVGAAIAAYLRKGRPASHDRHVFLRAQAPIRGLTVGSDVIGSIVRCALERAGVKAPHRGSHQFRHALAVNMLQQGASLEEIGEVLRHQSPQTTSIYARVDISALRSLALPWPGGAR